MRSGILAVVIGALAACSDSTPPRQSDPTASATILKKDCSDPKWQESLHCTLQYARDFHLAVSTTPIAKADVPTQPCPTFFARAFACSAGGSATSRSLIGFPEPAVSAEPEPMATSAVTSKVQSRTAFLTCLTE